MGAQKLAGLLITDKNLRKAPLFKSETSRYDKFTKLSGTIKICPQIFRWIYQRLAILHGGISNAGL